MLKSKAEAAPRVRMTGGPDLAEQWDRPREDGRDDDAPRKRQPTERIADEDMTLTASVISEEIHQALEDGWAIDQVVADAVYLFECRKHAPHLLASEGVPLE